MRALTIEAGSLPVAQALYHALSEFQSELIGDDSEGYRVTVEVGHDQPRIERVLKAIKVHVIARNDGPAQIDLSGHRYTLHSESVESPTDGSADRVRGLILLRATLASVAERLDESSLEDLGLLTRMSELSDLVDQDLQRLAGHREP